MNAVNKEVGFGDLILVLFLGLKMAHFIDWSWWWVLSPLWLSGILSLVMIAWVNRPKKQAADASALLQQFLP